MRLIGFETVDTLGRVTASLFSNLNYTPTSNDEFNENIIATGTVVCLAFSNLTNNRFTRTSNAIMRAEP